MQYVSKPRKTFVRSRDAGQTIRMFSSREISERLSCRPAEVEEELRQRGLSYHKNSGGLLWQLWSEVD